MPLTTDDLAPYLLATFGGDPALRDELREYADLPHLQTAAFARLMQRAARAGDLETYARAAGVADELWRGADDSLRNALSVSFLEHLEFSGARGPQLWALLSPTLQVAWREMAAYNASLHSGATGTPSSRQAAV